MEVRADTRSCRERGITRWELVAAVVIIGMAVFFLASFLNPRGSLRGTRVSCMGNLHQLGMVLALYANENMDQFPPLDQRPGNVMVDANVLYPEFLSDMSVFGCPNDPRFDPKTSLRLARVTMLHEGFTVGDPHPDCVDTTSYQFLGYALHTDADLRAYIEADVPRGRARSKADFGVEPLAYDVDIDYAVPRDPHAPVMWDRPPGAGEASAHRDGAQNVVFMDGHVELLAREERSERFPVSAFSREWLLSQVPAPSGNPADPWGDCP